MGFSRQASLIGEVLGSKGLGSTGHGVKEGGRFFKAYSNKSKNFSGSSFSKASSNRDME